MAAIYTPKVQFSRSSPALSIPTPILHDTLVKMKRYVQFAQVLLKFIDTRSATEVPLQSDHASTGQPSPPHCRSVAASRFYLQTIDVQQVPPVSIFPLLVCFQMRLIRPRPLLAHLACRYGFFCPDQRLRFNHYSHNASGCFAIIASPSAQGEQPIAGNKPSYAGSKLPLRSTGNLPDNPYVRATQWGARLPGPACLVFQFRQPIEVYRPLRGRRDDPQAGCTDGRNRKVFLCEQGVPARFTTKTGGTARRRKSTRSSIA
ncbi:uncharacterized protein B0H18DRAFT_33576 [Fomitopsis serialis]|uniref:uncharacterized protein n=1 Tax=Fomitopsis serialis TaxID=139415 RepID=UPI002008CCF4|nr:uncharacterized protein B0H18DRAFT_33576 [Neoantrodia serialis]KAH9932640.1 hypothetical protein B0H18DRAFT_33576 [Neoantrodia serialis]